MEVHGLMTLFITDEAYGRVRVQVCFYFMHLNYIKFHCGHYSVKISIFGYLGLNFQSSVTKISPNFGIKVKISPNSGIKVKIMVLKSTFFSFKL